MGGTVMDVVAEELDPVHGRIAGRFGRAHPRVREYVSGLAAGLERKNGWTLAERAASLAPTTPEPGPAMSLPAARLCLA